MFELPLWNQNSAHATWWQDDCATEIQKKKTNQNPPLLLGTEKNNAWNCDVYASRLRACHKLMHFTDPTPPPAAMDWGEEASPKTQFQWRRFRYTHLGT